MFHCQFCSVRSELLKHHLNHRIFHLNLSEKFWCGYNGCQHSFNCEISLRSHLRRIHLSSVDNKLNNNILTNSCGTYECSVEICKKSFDNISGISKHIQSHIDNGQSIKCPISDCQKMYSNKCSFRSHLSKMHRTCNSEHSEVTNHITRNEQINKNNFLKFPQLSQDTLCCRSVQVDDEESLDTNNKLPTDIPFELFLRNFTEFYLKLESLCLVPVVTIQYIISHFKSIHEQQQRILRKNLQIKLLQEGTLQDKINDVLNEVCQNDFLSQCSDVLSTDYKRKKHYQQQLDYTCPIEIQIGINEGRRQFFHYVPILETLKKLYADKSMEHELNNVENNQDQNLLTDFFDGSNFKNNNFFHEKPELLKIILYQDSFEVVNPLGSAIKKHKILAVYLSLGNISDYKRSHVNSIKLVALCKEQDFIHDKVYGPICEDLKYIETKGVQLPSGQRIKGTVVFIAGDNLGSHQLGGFTENFSTATYLCRYCYITREEFNDENKFLATFVPRNVESYNRDLTNIKENSYKGVKFNSIFNSLQHFHVCQPGLPPCLGHDLLEGIVAYDLQIYLTDLVNKKWFSFSTLNKKINTFRYSAMDKKDKPCPVSEKKNRIVGAAWQIFNFLRLLPLLLFDNIKNAQDETWHCILLLTEITEIVCAPKINKSILPYLQYLINDYLTLRRMFKVLRPKHHYLSHYPDLILKFGPLMKVWTMRFESKHSYFKKILKISKNFINITKNMSEKHELLQCLLRLGSDIRPRIEIIQGSSFNYLQYNNMIQNAAKMLHLSDNVLQCEQIVIKGTTYKKGNVLCCSQDAYQYNILVGRICLILSDEENAFIILEELETIFWPKIRSYELGKTIQYVGIPFDELPSHEALHTYRVYNSLFVKPCYGFVQRRL